MSSNTSRCDNATHTNLRIGELAGLERSCVNLEKGEIHVEKIGAKIASAACSTLSA